jgi:hypothetical protein
VQTRRPGRTRDLGPNEDPPITMRNLLHYLISILLWILFGYYWYVVFQRQIGPDSIQPLGILFGITVLGLAITLWWIAHNKRIAARGKRKTLMPPPAEPFEFDTLNRPIIAPEMALLKTAGRVTVKMNDFGHKVYTIDPEGEV